MRLQRRSGVGDPPPPPFLQTAWGFQFCSFPSDMISEDFVEGFPIATQKLEVYFLKLILYAIWHFRKMKRFERVACTAQNAISLVEFRFKQTCSKKFEFWRRELKFSMFKKLERLSAELTAWTVWFLLFLDVIYLYYFC